jgi:hypothetical protein
MSVFSGPTLTTITVIEVSYDSGDLVKGGEEKWNMWSSEGDTLKVKVKITLEQATKIQRGSGSIALLFL